MSLLDADTSGHADGLDTGSILESVPGVDDPAPDTEKADEIPGDILDAASRAVEPVWVEDKEW